MTSASELHRVVARHLCFRAAAPLSWGFGPRSVGLAAFGSDLPVQGFAPFAKRYLLVAGPCLLAVGSAPLTDFRRLPRCSASTSRPSSSRRSLASCRCYPILGVLPLLRFPPLGSYPEQCPAGLTAGRVHPWRCRVGLRRTMAGRGRLQRFTPLGGGSPSPAHPPTRGSKPFSVLRRRLGLLAFRLQGCYLLWRPVPWPSSTRRFCNSSNTPVCAHAGPTTPLLYSLFLEELL
jgi:hypothetical protein